MKRALVLTIMLVAGTMAALVPPSAQAATTIERAQWHLNKLGCDAGPQDGRLGTWTKAALIRFQSRHGFPQTGKLDTTTRTRLLAGTGRWCDTRAVPWQAGKRRQIVISQSQNWVWITDTRGRVIVQAGMIDNPSVLRKGTYRTGSYCGRAARVKLNRSGSLWLDNFVRFAPCGVGFHQIPRRMAGGASIHGTNILGTNMSESHGCIRLSRTMSLKVWNFTSGRTTVIKVV
ncbi:MAG TPA: L,D-transpeptidase family protein [Nocardioides sp.]